MCEVEHVEESSPEVRGVSPPGIDGSEDGGHDIDDEDRGIVAADLGLKSGTLNVRLHRARAAFGDALMAHCGPCCRHGFDDCSCPPDGCEHPVEETDCEDQHTAS